MLGLSGSQSNWMMTCACWKACRPFLPVSVRRELRIWLKEGSARRMLPRIGLGRTCARWSPMRVIQARPLTTPPRRTGHYNRVWRRTSEPQRVRESFVAEQAKR